MKHLNISVMMVFFCSVVCASTPDALDDYCGKYRYRDYLITVAEKDDKLIFSTPVYPDAITLTRQSERVYRAEQVGFQNTPFDVEFRKDRNGVVHSIQFQYGNRTYTARRVIMGNWEGKFETGPMSGQSLQVKLIAYGGGEYNAVFIMDNNEKRFEIPGKHDQGKTIFEGKTSLAVAYQIKAEIYNRKFTGAVKADDSESTFTLHQVFKSSPTLGMKPPEGAIVLLPNERFRSEESEKLLNEEWIIQPHWQLNYDGAVRISGSNMYSKREFGDARIHIEFQTPFMPEERGQARGNSGVYIQNRYEVQVLDSFGLEPKDNLCGGIYKYATPSADVCLPPLEWQTYDITFHASRFDEDGNKTKSAVITVKHNGEIIHDEVVLKGRSNESPTGPIRLQDHNLDRVAYRNIWVVPLDE